MIVFSRHLLSQRSMWKHQNNDWYLFKAKIKDAKTNSGVFVVNFKQILPYCSGDTIVGFEQVNVGWVLIPDIPDVLKSLLPSSSAS